MLTTSRDFLIASARLIWLNCHRSYMTANHKFHGILSLSAASIALSHSVSAKGQPLDQTLTGSAESLNAQNAPKTANLVLAPAHHEELARLYADHASHASHASHESHASHYSGASDYSAPVAPAPPPPSYPTNSQPQPQPQRQPITPIATTNSVNQAVAPTNSVNSTKQAGMLNATNTVAEETTSTNTALVDFLKKRASEGFADAQYSLAICYLNGGDGVEKDTNRAGLLLEMSAGQGNTQAKEKLEELKQAPKDSDKSDK
jgi:TPR repeat protein